MRSICLYALCIALIPGLAIGSDDSSAQNKQQSQVTQLQLYIPDVQAYLPNCDITQTQAYQFVADHPHDIAFTALGMSSIGYIAYYAYAYWIAQLDHAPSKYERAALYAAACGFAVTTYYVITTHYYDHARPLCDAFNRVSQWYNASSNNTA